MPDGADRRDGRRRRRPRPTAVATIPNRLGEQDRPDDDPGRVEDRGERIEQEPAVGDEDLAERERGGEEDLGEAVDPQQLDVERPGSTGRSRADDVGQPRRREEDEDAGDRHHPDRPGQHGPAEVVGAASPSSVAAQAAVDRDERRGQPGGHQHVERDLRDPERGVVGVELGAGAVGVGEDPVADDAHREVAERQDGQDDRAAREDASTSPRTQPIGLDSAVIRSNPGACHRRRPTSIARGR